MPGIDSFSLSNCGLDGPGGSSINSQKIPISYNPAAFGVTGSWVYTNVVTIPAGAKILSFVTTGDTSVRITNAQDSASIELVDSGNRVWELFSASTLSAPDFLLAFSIYATEASGDVARLINNSQSHVSRPVPTGFDISGGLTLRVGALARASSVTIRVNGSLRVG